MKKIQSQKLANISRRIRDSIKLNQSKGANLTTGQWGLGYDTETNKFVCKDGESCALTHLVVKEQPKVSKTLTRKLQSARTEALRDAETYGYTVNPEDTRIVDAEDYVMGILQRHLGVPTKFLEEFVAGFDDGIDDDSEDSDFSRPTAGRRLGARIATAFSV